MSPLLETWRITMPFSKRAAMKSFAFAPACFKARAKIQGEALCPGYPPKHGSPLSRREAQIPAISILIKSTCSPGLK